MPPEIKANISSLQTKIINTPLLTTGSFEGLKGINRHTKHSNMKKFILLSLPLLCAVSTLSAKDAVVVVQDTKLYEQPSVKGYVTTTADNRDLVVNKGMVFIFTPASSGWSKVEYLSGINAYMSTDASAPATSTSPVAPAVYPVRNTQAKATIARTGDNYTLTVGSKSYPGRAYGGAVLFTDPTGNVVYSAAVVNGETYVFDYSVLSW